MPRMSYARSHRRMNKNRSPSKVRYKFPDRDRAECTLLPCLARGRKLANSCAHDYILEEKEKDGKSAREPRSMQTSRESRSIHQRRKNNSYATGLSRRVGYTIFPLCPQEGTSRRAPLSRRLFKPMRRTFARLLIASVHCTHHPREA